MTTSIVVLVPIVSVAVFIPTNVNVIVCAPEGAVMEYFPSKSVSVPSVVPFTVTATLGMGSPSSAEVTVPLIVTVWAIRAEKPVNTNNAINSFNLFIDQSFSLTKKV